MKPPFVYYEGLKYHYEEALKEIGQEPGGATNNPEVAIFSRSYYEDINNLNHDKMYDYVFIGTFSINSQHNRIWVLNFVKTHFTDNSIFINVGAGSDWKKLGKYDLTGQVECSSPILYSDSENQTREAQYRLVNENKFYFETMCRAKYCLCPAGDSAWSFRFYEVLMCKSIPIVESWLHTFRTETESTFGYKYLLYNEPHTFDTNIINHNTTLFEKRHLLPKVHFFTYATEEHKLKDLAESAKMFGINISCSLAQSWGGFIDKIINKIEVYKNIPDNEIVCFIDGYDMIVNSNIYEIIDKFNSYKCDLLFGAEMHCWPRTHLQEMDKITDHRMKYKYLNAGGYIGYKHAIMEALLWKPLDEIKDIVQDNTQTDQSYFMSYYIHHPHKIKLDNRQKIFQNMYLVRWTDVCVQHGRFYNFKLDETPCFVHFSGNSWMTQSGKSVIPILIEAMKQTKDHNIFKEFLLRNTPNSKWDRVKQL
jgi:uncharacterized protein YlzI (FlbEa/FlbD family)